ncbi:MAG: hypothetical protein GEV10_15725 [Streptosporangiales bacterium]|nr:hypothetical protein [Streptosporangiales bacterium]
MTVQEEEPSGASGAHVARSTRKRTRRLPRWVGPTVALVAFASLTPMAYTLKLGVVTTLTTVLMFAAVAQGWNLLGGFGGYLNFGMVVFFGTGVYTSAILDNQLGWSVWTTLPIAGLVAAILALPVGLATLRLRGHYFAIFTLVITFLMLSAAANLSITRGANGLYTTAPVTGTRPIAALFFYAFLALVVVATALAFVVQHSNLGYALRAIREDEDAAAVLGVRTTTVKLGALLLGGAVAGVAGGLYAFQTGYIEPVGTFSLSTSLDIVLICVIGGLGTWQGPLIGAGIVVLLEQWLRTALAGFHPFGWEIPVESNRVVLGLLLVLFALYARRGVVGLFSSARGRRLSV